MKAVMFHGAGSGDVIGIAEVPTPAVGPHQVRVRVRAAGINRADLMQRRGSYPAPPGWPANIPGLEYAGEIEAVGGDVSRWAVGDRVMGLVGGGAQAEFVVAHELEMLAIPPALTFAEAAAVPESFLTAYDALTRRARLVAGERLLVHAAGSGLGTAAIQIAKRLGAIVTGTSRSADKLARATLLGLDAGIDTSRASFRESIDPPVDAVLDVLGATALADNLAVLRERGRLVILGLMTGSEGSINLGEVLRRRLEVIGSVMRTRGPEERAGLVAEFAEAMLPLFETGRLRPVVDHVVRMDQLAEGHRAMEKNETFGKLVATWD
jgi:putative PIG3 family NAD(P)H quinone oxidoreductase